MCDLCDYNYLQTPAHILAECASFLALRTEIFQALILEPPFLHPISKIFKFLHQSELEALQWETAGVVDNTTT